MKVEIEFRSRIGRRELFQMMRIVSEAAERLARRMTGRELILLATFAAAVSSVAENECSKRRLRTLREYDRAASGPSREGKTFDA